MPLVPNFIGPAYRSRSKVINADTLYNLYIETTEKSGAVKPATFIGTPGLDLRASVDESGCRGMFSQDGLNLGVIGDGLYTMSADGVTLTRIGGIQNDGAPVSFASNGQGGEQIAIVGGGELKILNLLTMAVSAPVALPLTNTPRQVRYIDGYFLLSERDSIRVWFSALEDGLVWDALDFFARSQTSDNIVSFEVLRNRVWVLGSLTGEVYYDSGDADNPFVPYPGSVMQEGLASPYALAVQGESLTWLAQDSEGTRRIVRAQDYTPTVISTYALAYALGTYPRVDDAELLVYEQENHPFAIYTFPSAGDAGASWGFDQREQDQVHQRSTWNEDIGIHMRWRARGCCSTGSAILVGDRDNGNVYALDLDVFTDNDGMMVAERTAPYLSGENQWIFVDSVELGCQTGVGLSNPASQGYDPVALFSLSRDGGQTFVASPDNAKLGKMGEYLERVIWRQLGRARADRLALRIRITDPVRRVLGPGLWLKASPGTGQL